MNTKLLVGIVLTLAVVSGSLMLLTDKQGEGPVPAEAVAAISEPAVNESASVAVSTAAAATPDDIVLVQADTARSFDGAKT